MARIRGFIKRAPRVGIDRAALLVNSDGLESEVMVLDISSGGFRLKGPQLQVRIGEFVTLRVEHDEEFPAQIRWVLGDEAGAVFLEAVDYDRWTRDQ